MKLRLHSSMRCGGRTRVFQHNGIDFYGIGRALVRDLMSGSLAKAPVA